MIDIWLWVDDERMPPSDEWVVVRSSEQAIAVLRKGGVRRLSLDFDLGGEDTGMKVVDWLDQKTFTGRFLLPTDVIIHSMSPVGADNLMRALRRIYLREAQGAFTLARRPVFVT